MRYHLTTSSTSPPLPPSILPTIYSHAHTRLNYGIICVKALDANKMYVYVRADIRMHACSLHHAPASKAKILPRWSAPAGIRRVPPFPLDPAIHMRRSRVRPVKAARLARNILMGRSTGCLFVKRHLTELLFRLKISDSYSIKRLFLTFLQFVLNNFAGKAK